MGGRPTPTVPAGPGAVGAFLFAGREGRERTPLHRLEQPVVSAHHPQALHVLDLLPGGGEADPAEARGDGGFLPVLGLPDVEQLDLADAHVLGVAGTGCEEGAASLRYHQLPGRGGIVGPARALLELLIGTLECAEGGAPGS